MIPFQVKRMETGPCRNAARKRAQFVAEQTVGIANQEKFQQELIVEQLKADLKAQNPEFRYVTVTDNAGNTTLVTTNKNTNETELTSLGQIGKYRDRFELVGPGRISREHSQTSRKPKLEMIFYFS